MQIVLQKWRKDSGEEKESREKFIKKMKFVKNLLENWSPSLEKMDSGKPHFSWSISFFLYEM